VRALGQGPVCSTLQLFHLALAHGSLPGSPCCAGGLESLPRRFPDVCVADSVCDGTQTDTSTGPLPCQFFAVHYESPGSSAFARHAFAQVRSTCILLHVVNSPHWMRLKFEARNLMNKLTFGKKNDKIVSKYGHEMSTCDYLKSPFLSSWLSACN